MEEEGETGWAKAFPPPDDDDEGIEGEVQPEVARPRRWLVRVLAISVVLLLGASLVGAVVVKPASAADSIEQFCNRVKVYAEAGRALSEPAVASNLVSHAPREIRGVVKTTVVMARLDDKGRQQYVSNHPTEADDPALFQEWLTVQCNL
jgi:hypothetical protein